MDCVLMSMNAMDDLGGGHGRRLLERYGDDGRLGFIAMKVFGSDGAPLLKETGLDAATALRFVWSSPVATAVVGTHSMKDLEENIHAARNFTPMSDEERIRLEKRIEKPTSRLWQISA